MKVTILTILTDSSITRLNPACNRPFLHRYSRSRPVTEVEFLTKTAQKDDSKCDYSCVRRKVVILDKVVILLARA